MRIGIEAQRIFRTKKHGMDRVVLEVIKQLQIIDKVNDYFIFVNEGEDRCLEETANFKIITFGGNYPLWEQIKLPKKVKEMKVDLLHCTSNTAPLRIDAKLVLTLHDIIFLEKNNLLAKGFTPYQKFGNVYRSIVVPRILKHCEKVITVSHFEKENIKQRLPQIKEKLTVIYNGAHPMFQIIQDQDFLESIKKKYDLRNRFFFFFGNTDPKKNTPNLIKAYALYASEAKVPIPLVIVDYSEQLIEEQLRKLGKLELKKFIDVKGYITNTDIPAILNLSECLLYPSQRESFGIPIVEGMACGTPVITSNTSSMPEIAGDAALLVDPYSIEEMAQAMHKVEENKPFINELVARGLERAKQFTWLKAAETTLRIYKELL